MKTISILATILWGCLTLPAQEFDFKTFARDLVDLEALSRLDSPPVKMVSSYDRTGGNHDGFNEAWRKDGTYTLFEAGGPGVVRRFYAGLPGGRLLIFIDGNPVPVVDMPCEEFFAGRHQPFVRPMVGPMGMSNYSFFPIPFAKSIKIQTVPLPSQDPKPRPGREFGVYYQVTYQSFPEGTPIRSLKLPLSPGEQDAWDRVGTAWRKVGEDPKPESGIQRVAAVSTRIGPGDTADLIRLTGPAVIDRLYLKIAPADPALLRSTLLRIHWDDEETLAVDCPVGDFFGNGFTAAPFKSLPIGLTDDGYYCYFAMPFGRRATISLVNESAGIPLEADARVVYRPTRALPPGTGTFHAKWRREDVAAVNENGLNRTGEYNFRILDVHGRGRYIGFNLNVFNRYIHWWGEGDPMVFVDDEVWPPSIHGTGTEETFNDGWGFHQFIHAAGSDPSGRERNVIPVSGVLAGGEEDSLVLYGGNAVFTFNIADSVPFSRRLLATIEHGNGANQLSNDYCATAYWYAAPGSRDFFLMRPPAERKAIPTGEWPALREAAIQDLRRQLAVMSEDIRRLPPVEWKRVQHLWLYETVIGVSDRLGLSPIDRDRFQKRFLGFTGTEEARDKMLTEMIVELAVILGPKEK
jgi:hypothetical protein